MFGIGDPLVGLRLGKYREGYLLPTHKPMKESYYNQSTTQPIQSPKDVHSEAKTNDAHVNYQYPSPLFFQHLHKPNQAIKRSFYPQSGPNNSAGLLFHSLIAFLVPLTQGA